MFNNYTKYYDNYIKYLMTLNGQMNSNDMDNGFAITELLTLNVYGEYINHKYSGKFSEINNEVVLTDSSIATSELAKNIKLTYLAECMSTEYSLIDTLENIGNYLFFNGSAYMFTDYGLIEMYGRKCETNATSKITSINAWTNSEENKNKIQEFINAHLIKIPSDKKQKNLTICTSSSYGIKKSKIEVKPFNCDVNKNYNDDIPYDKLTQLVNSEQEELILLHGDPGTGKTSIIKQLIHDNPSIEFVIFDHNLLTDISDGRLFEFLSEHKQYVFILEDCEKLFTDRNNGNRFISSMLNLTDGIVGEAFGIKFLCTFNCPKSKIDKAVLREGRLSLIYEFKKLSLEKTKALLPTATEPMTLAQIYHTEDNGNKKDTKKIGF